MTDCRKTGKFWAASQASPMRRVNINGNLTLMDYCTDGPQWASGGFIADSKAGNVVNGSQQQYLVRNSSVGTWSNGVWNQVFLGAQGAPATNFGDTIPDTSTGGTMLGTYTTLPTNPASREKPYLYVDSAGGYNVLVPSAADQLRRRQLGERADARQVHPAVRASTWPSRPTRWPPSTRNWPPASTCCSPPASTTLPRRSPSTVPTPSFSAWVSPSLTRGQRVDTVEGRRRQGRCPGRHHGRRRQGQLAGAGHHRHADTAATAPQRRRPDHTQRRVLPDRRTAGRQCHPRHGDEQRQRHARQHLVLACRPRHRRQPSAGTSAPPTPDWSSTATTSPPPDFSSSTTRSTTSSGTARTAGPSSSRTRCRTTRRTRAPGAQGRCWATPATRSPIR